MKFILSLMMLSFINLFSQIGSTAIIKGEITDYYNGKPISVNIEFRDNNGSRIKIISNSITGMFEQVLKPGEHYKVLFSGDNILREEIEYNMPDSGKFFETFVKWKAKNMNVGATIYDYKLFRPNSADIIDEGMEYLNNLKEVIRFNRAISIEMTVCSKDSFKGEKNIPITKFKELVELRIQKLNSIISEWKREKTRISIVNSKAELPASIDTQVKITKIDELFK